MPRLTHLDIEFDTLRRERYAGGRCRNDVPLGGRHFRKEVESVGIGGGGTLHPQGWVLQRHLNAGHRNVLQVFGVSGDQSFILGQADCETCRQEQQDEPSAPHTESPPNSTVLRRDRAVSYAGVPYSSPESRGSTPTKGATCTGNFR